MDAIVLQHHVLALDQRRIARGVDGVDGLVFHMGTKMTDEGLVTDGGRVLMVVTLEDDLQTAFDHTYKELEKIQCKDLFHRNDIGKKDM